MKKILFGSAAAICAVVGFSAFKSVKPNPTLYWFKAVKNFPAATNPTGVYNTQVTFYTLTATPADICQVGTQFDCLIGFTKARVVTTVTPVKLLTATRAPQTAISNFAIRN